MSDEEPKLTMYSDYVCPFCYLGRRSLVDYLETSERDLGIEWHPFDLRHHKRGPDGEIDHSVDDGKDEEYFEQARQNVERLQDEYDVTEMRNLDDIPEVDSLDAQVASYYVQTAYPDTWFEFDEAIFEALWVEGRDIGDVDVLAELAAEVGLDGDEIRAAVTDEQRRAEIRDRFVAANRAGISGVPTFEYDGYAARGAVPPEHIERLIEGQ